LIHSLHLISPDIERQLRAISTGQNPYPGVTHDATKLILQFIADESTANGAVYFDVTEVDHTQSSTIAHSKQVNIWFDPAIKNLTIENIILESLFKILHNLIKNPFEHQANIIFIRLSLKDNDPKKIKLELIDNGTGLPMPHFISLFRSDVIVSLERSGRQEDSSRNWHKGLAFCIENFKKLKQKDCIFTVTWAKHENQDAHIQSSEAVPFEHGTCFEITLPVLENASQEKKISACDSRLTQDQTMLQQKKPNACILLVDDDEICLSLLLRKVVHNLNCPDLEKTKDTLFEMTKKENEFPGLLLSDDIQIYCAKNITDAFEIVRRNKPSLVISDYNMPGGNGKELIQKIREIEQEQQSTQPTLLILHTDTVQFTSEQSSLQVYDVHHLEKRKPFGNSQVLAHFIVGHAKLDLVQDL
jgi:CheY-like chemotaxis protein